ncbi:putative DUF3850 domain-containing protein [Desulfarculales bacterium]
MSGEASKAARPKKQHELKEWPEFFVHTLSGRKKFQLRLNDRDFQVGDELLIKEWDNKGEYGSPAEKTEPVGYTGRAVVLRVDYIMRSEDTRGVESKFVPIALGYIIMSTSLVS